MGVAKGHVDSRLTNADGERVGRDFYAVLEDGHGEEGQERDEERPGFGAIFGDEDRDEKHVHENDPCGNQIDRSEMSGLNKKGRAVERGRDKAPGQRDHGDIGTADFHSGPGNRDQDEPITDIAMANEPGDPAKE